MKCRISLEWSIECLTLLWLEELFKKLNEDDWHNNSLWTLRDLKVKLFVRNKCLLNVLLTGFSHMVIFFECTCLYFKEQDSKRVGIKPLERGSKILSIIAFNVDREDILFSFSNSLYLDSSFLYSLTLSWDISIKSIKECHE